MKTFNAKNLDRFCRKRPKVKKQDFMVFYYVNVFNNKLEEKPQRYNPSEDY